MPTYAVYGVVSGTIFLGNITADTEEAAIAEGLNSPHNLAMLCENCASNISMDDVRARSAIAVLIKGDR